GNATPNTNDAYNGMLDKTDAAGSNKAVLVMLTKTRSSSGDGDQGCGHEEPSAEKEELGEQGLAESSHAGKSNDERGAPAARLPETIVVVAGLDKGNLGSANVGATHTGSSSGHGETREEAAEAQLGEV
ncbi:hypothetical protein TeGR_g14546, partial [Tetraparma gracilis]